MRLFEPFFRNPHLATIAGNFWRRPEIERRWPTESLVVRTEPGVEVLLQLQRPAGRPKGEIVLVHGLEGSSEAGYARSMACASLERGYAVLRFNLRGCGGDQPPLARGHATSAALACGNAASPALSNYHAGQTSDLHYVLRERSRLNGAPLFVVGYSLGGNVALKLAGELGAEANALLEGVCAVSVPIDLAACAAALERPANFLYQDRFLRRLKQRIRRRHAQAPDTYTLEYLPRIRTITDFDNYYTARLFGFGTAANYFRTQSSNQFLDGIRTPTLIVQAKDDPLIPFSVFDHPAFTRNPHLRLLAVEHGGHLGFLSRRRPRFWLDEVVMDWVEETAKPRAAAIG